MKNFIKSNLGVSGASLIEFSLVAPIVLLLTGGIFELLYFGFQYNRAVKAAERGVRIAAVSDPVAVTLSSASIISCSSVSQTLDVASLNVNCGGASVNSDAFARIFFGRKRSVGGQFNCDDGYRSYYVGMCDVFPKLRPFNVTISYSPSDLDFPGNPDGPIPIIRVSLGSIPFDSAFISPLTGYFSRVMGPISATAIGEDLKSKYP